MAITLCAIECGGTSFRIAICEWPNTGTTNGGDDPDDDDHDTNTFSLDDPGNQITFLHRQQLPTDMGIPQLTTQIQQVIQSYAHVIQAVGIASFGPIQLHHTHHTNHNNNDNDNKEASPEEDRYGEILPTSPKLEFHHFNIVNIVQAALLSHPTNHHRKIPILVDTDVNAPALAEYRQYNHRQQPTKHHPATTISSLAYVTVGTGVGVGLVIQNQPVHGALHPEMGHVPVLPPVTASHNNNDDDDDFTGYSWGRRPHSNIPFSGRYTIEGMISSVALTERYHQQQQQQVSATTETTTSPPPNDRNILATLDDEDEMWDHVAHYVATLCTILFLTVSIERIVLGGGVISGRANTLLPKIHTLVHSQLNGYLAPLSTLESIQSRIGPSQYFGHDAGLYGAIYLAQQAYHNDHSHHRHPDQRTLKNDDDDDDRDPILPTTAVKQRAFAHGLWHGMIIGIVGTALLIQYASSGRRRSR